ncbi:hypothetical protein BDZ91DRAFT_768651 [Kalaharituber pfeilii]|nr:hypothetical protein BDZ91DRAFT_768651 [Kalaharituber pfeilii]
MATCDPDCGSFGEMIGMDWCGARLRFQQGNSWYSTIPECIAPGEYLIRQIISMSDGYKLGIYKPTDPGALFNTNTAYTYYPIPQVKDGNQEGLGGRLFRKSGT